MRDHDAVDGTTSSIQVPLQEHLRVAAAERRVSMADTVREAIEEELAAHRPKPYCVGVGASGHRDTARKASDERPESRAWR